MDAISRAILNGRHISKNKKINYHTWERCIKESANKKIFIFGIGNATYLFWERFRDTENLVGIIDNDEKKWGVTADKYILSNCNESIGKYIIQPPDILKNYNPENIAVLISSINYYEKIADQLESSGIKNYYSMLIMESKKHYEIYNKNRSDDNNDSWDFYIQKYKNEQIDEKKVVFSGLYTYSGHEKYILEKLCKLRSDLDIVYITEDLRTELPKNARLVYKKNTDSSIYELSTAKAVIDNMLGIMIPKKRGQVYIEVKHWASITLKKFGADMVITKGDEEYFNVVKKIGESLDYIIVGSELDRKSCKSGFLYQGNWLDFGSPRSDILFSENDFKSILYEKYRINKNVKTVLYCPTFRYKKEKDGLKEEFKTYLDFDKIKIACDNFFKDACRILLRLHPSVASKSHEIELLENRGFEIP